MQGSSNSAHFFLSAHSPQGFVSKLNELYNPKEGWKTYILKGGPGSGKSAFLKKIGDAFLTGGYFVEMIHCTNDYRELDAVSIPEIRLCLLDGTAPHSVEPAYPGAVESLINLGDCWDEKMLTEQRDKIILFANRSQALYDRAYRLFNAAGSLLSDTCRLSLECTDVAKLERYATRVAKKEFLQKHCQGSETIRFLTAITPSGIVSFGNSAAAEYKRVFAIEDDFGIGRYLLGKLRIYALSAGYDVISCYCPMAPDEKLEHLFIPALSLCFVTSGRYHRFTGKNYRHIHMRRFINAELIRLRRNRVNFNRKASKELLNEGIALLKEAQANYEVLKGFYRQATDFDLVNKMANDLLDKLLPGPAEE